MQSNSIWQLIIIRALPKQYIITTIQAATNLLPITTKLVTTREYEMDDYLDSVCVACNAAIVTWLVFFGLMGVMM